MSDDKTIDQLREERRQRHDPDIPGPGDAGADDEKSIDELRREFRARRSS